MFHRRTPTHGQPVMRGNVSELQFVTVCTKNRQPILANPAVHCLLLEAWAFADDWVVGRYVVMPDHIHLFCAPASWNSRELSMWMKHWKSVSSRRWPEAIERPIWQRSHWDYRIRSAEEDLNKWEYVRLNPVRAGFVSMAEEWPFAGEIHSLSV